MTLWTVLALVAAHFVGDFLLQTEWEATEKWHDFDALSQHTVTYAVLFIFWGVPFVLITLVAHTLTDYFTSKINHRLAESAKTSGKWHNFFAMIGFDQTLHYAQLFVTAYYLLR